MDGDSAEASCNALSLRCGNQESSSILFGDYLDDGSNQCNGAALCTASGETGFIWWFYAWQSIGLSKATSKHRLTALLISSPDLLSTNLSNWIFWRIGCGWRPEKQERLMQTRDDQSIRWFNPFNNSQLRKTPGEQIAFLQFHVFGLGSCKFPLWPRMACPCCFGSTLHGNSFASIETRQFRELGLALVGGQNGGPFYTIFYTMFFNAMFILFIRLSCDVLFFTYWSFVSLLAYHSWMCSKSMYDVMKEVRRKFIAINYTCFFCWGLFWKLYLVLVNGKTQELEPQMEKLQCGEPVEIVADIRLAIRAGSQHTRHAFCFFFSDKLNWHEQARFRDFVKQRILRVFLLISPRFECHSRPTAVPRRPTTLGDMMKVLNYNVSPCLCRCPDWPEGKTSIACTVVSVLRAEQVLPFACGRWHAGCWSLRSLKQFFWWWLIHKRSVQYNTFLLFESCHNACGLMQFSARRREKTFLLGNVVWQRPSELQKRCHF